MKPKTEPLPDEGLGRFLIVGGVIVILLPLLLSRMPWGQKLPAMAGGFSGLSWGLGQLAAAKRWRQKYGQPTIEEQIAIKKNHSISNLPKLLMWLVLSLAALFFLGIVFVILFHH
jgi:hypothetical protein